MLRYFLKRILWLIPVIMVVTFIVFGLLELAPGNIVDTMTSSNMTAEEYQALRAQYNLDKTVFYRYALYMFNLCRGDLGVSYVTGGNVWNMYMSRLPRTLLLSFTALVIGSLAAVLLGVVAARRAGKLADNVATTLSLIGMSMPGFWLGLLLLLLFSQQLGWFPAGGVEHGIRSLILPAVCSSFMLMATAARQTRSSMLEVLNAEYLRTARSKGVPEKVVIRKHALGNAWIPILTTIGMSFSMSIAGSVVVESVFNWPGVGRLATESLNARDVPATIGTVILTTILYVLVLLVVDLLYAFVDPRIKSQYVSKKRKKKYGSASDEKNADISVLPAEATEPGDRRILLPTEANLAQKEVTAADMPAGDVLPGRPVVTAAAVDMRALSRENEPEADRFVTRDMKRIYDNTIIAEETDASATLLTRKYRKRSQFGTVIHHIRQNKGAVIGMCIIAALLVTLLASLTISYDSVTSMNAANRLAAPSLKFPFGTDGLGRNAFLRAMYGTRYSLAIGAGVVGVATLFGVILGSVAGHYGGIVDDVIMRISDTLASIPGMLLGMVIVTVMGNSLRNLIIAVGIPTIPIFTRITRASALTIRDNEYIEAARAIGLSGPRIILTQVLPNGLAPILVSMTVSFGIAILTAAALSFLGYGVPVPQPEWGAMVSNGREFVQRAPWLQTYPGLLILITVLAANLLGDGLRDALDPKLKK